MADTYERTIAATKKLMADKDFAASVRKANAAGDEEFNRYKDPAKLAAKRKEDAEFFAKGRKKLAPAKFKKGGMVRQNRDYPK